MAGDACPVCGVTMDERGLDGNYRTYHCPECDVEVLRPVASDHGGFSVEDLSNAASFGSDET